MKTIGFITLNIILTICFVYYFILFGFAHAFLIYPTYIIFVVLLINFGLIIFKKYQIALKIFIVLTHIMFGYALFIGWLSGDILSLLSTITAFFFIFPTIAVLLYWLKIIVNIMKK